MKAGLIVSSSGQYGQARLGTLTQLPKPTATAKKPSAPKPVNKRATKETDKRPHKRSKRDNPCYPKMDNTSGSTTPSNTSAAILLEDYDIYTRKSLEDRREMLSHFRYKVGCLSLFFLKLNYANIL